MKRKLLMGLLLLSGLVASADMYSYNITGINVFDELSVSPGAGTGWYVALMDNNNVELASTIVEINNAGSLYILAWDTPDLEELTEVHYRVYNTDAAGGAGATYKIDSSSYVLQDVTDPVGPTDLQIPQGPGENLDFTGQTWVAIPEPATFGMMAVAGFGLFLARKKAHR